MINTIKEFSEKHPYADIVNYDAAELFDDYGLTYRTDVKSLEKFRMVRGKYIEYPYIQPYLTLSDKSNYELFIIHNHKMYQLEKGTKENTYKIKKEIEDINPNIYKDDVFYGEGCNKKIEPRIINEELYIIEE